MPSRIMCAVLETSALTEDPVVLLGSILPHQHCDRHRQPQGLHPPSDYQPSADRAFASST